MFYKTDRKVLSAIIKLNSPISIERNEQVLKLVVNTFKNNNFNSFIIDFLPRIFKGHKNLFIIDNNTPNIERISGCAARIEDYKKELDCAIWSCYKEETNAVYIDLLLFNSHLNDVIKLQGSLNSIFEQVANILKIDVNTIEFN